jgi:acetyl-CoA C-acetyltransferase
VSKKQQAVIVSAVRTPMGSFNGVFSPVPATKLGSIAVAEALKRTSVRPDRVDEVYMGCVLSAGLGQVPARQASIGASIPNAVGATGARILTTLLHAMEARGARRGLAGLCIGGGEALAIVLEQM